MAMPGAMFTCKKTPLKVQHKTRRAWLTKALPRLKACTLNKNANIRSTSTMLMIYVLEEWLNPERLLLSPCWSAMHSMRVTDHYSSTAYPMHQANLILFLLCFSVITCAILYTP